MQSYASVRIRQVSICNLEPLSVASPSRLTNRPEPGLIARLAALDLDGATVTGGFWAERLRVNRERSLPHGFEQLQLAGNLANLRLAAGGKGRYHTIGAELGLDLPFLDSDVYKWLEAVAWELRHAAEPGLRSAADEAIGVIEAAQRPDGYLNSYVQVIAPGREYADLAWGHEPYCIGHLVQAGIAWHRALGDDRLLEVGIRAVDQMATALRAVAGPGIDGHPEIEMALVELFRTTGEERFLALAGQMIEGRGFGRLQPARFGSAYWQDHAAVREAPEVAGHAVRQVYLDSGAVDLAIETGDQGLLDAVVRRWRDMVATRSYLTGGLGSRHRDEAFGDPFELPPDRAYAETCAAVASVMLAWRLLLATGEPEFADVAERTMYNAALPGTSLAGTSFFYTNTLLRRSRRVAEDPDDSGRATWRACACCPPNLMRLLSSWPQYLATTDDDGVQVQQYANGEIDASIAGGPIRLGIETDYPWNGRIALTVIAAPDDPWRLTLRIPGWCVSASVTESVATAPGAGPQAATGARWVSPKRTWQAGDRVVLELDMPVRVTEADPRIDAIRGCVALERGPLVYCLESADLPAGVELDDLTVSATVAPSLVALPDDLLGSPVVGFALTLAGPDGRAVSTIAVPYFAWANRGDGAMRIWIPVS